MEDTTKTKKPIYKKWWFWVLAILIIAIIGSQSNKNRNSSDTGNSSEEKADIKPDAPTYSARSMYSDYEANEVSGDNKYKGKEFFVTGTVHSIGKDIMGRPYIGLQTSNIIGTVQCFIKDANSVSNISKGESVKIFGEGGGYLINVFVNDAKVIK